ncbi:amino acid adenylation domain-containing protein [Streptomyces rubradiris]|uniref:Carrier domain-containing protein n=1 Tax=Streptomyces rubradiris TaxID=285531 RepID=A0ABQ3RI93_STRRR|nr:amino acid adenylation domain-containing protein [Streptomyces rubradiris]GHH21536.1 hypothetical protein GCM10018792_56230 [Streptomyces rubradiris]GHI55583.1 hypothetical protein Srubr_54290 [Streptomyces rubradiris]
MNSLADTAWLEPVWARDPVLGPGAWPGDADRPTEPGADALLHDRFVAQAARTPDAVAVITPDRRLSYAEAARESAGVAHRLAQGGNGPGDLVGVVMEKGWEQVVGCLGVVRAGAAYVPLDPHWPARRLRDVLAAAGISTVLTQPSVRDAVDWPDGVEVLDITVPDSGTAPAAAPDVAVKPGDVAYVIYTSGSTGVPKGVVIEHGAAVNTVRDVNEQMSLTADDRVLGLSALTFDLSVYDIFGPLSVGGAVVLPAPEDSREPARWLELMNESGVTVWNSVPALMAMLCEYLTSATDLASPARDGLPPLRTVLMSGDWIPVTLPTEIWRFFPQAELWSLGGATEASIWSIWHRITPADASLPSIPYGTSMRNQRVFVADRLLRPRPPWVSGEICIAGAGLARGYLGDEERTDRSFVTSPVTGERIYRTGDWGRLLPSGEVEFLGREDMQVKVGGYRIELGDVEAALMRCDGVAAAVVTAPGDRGRVKLVAHVVLDAGSELTGGDIRRAVGEFLPPYMVPAHLVVRDELPLTRNGKVDRAALAQLPGEAAVAEEDALPATAEEHLLLSVWRSFFEAPALSVLDNFFELGGDSLQAVRMMSVLRREAGVTLPVSTLFSAPTVRALALRVRESRSDGDLSEPLVIPLRTTGSAVPLVFLHPVGGGVLCYSDLARSLGEDQPFYAVQSDDSGTEDATLTGLAAAYAKAITRTVPGERFRLGGWSMGGLLALETARELRGLGYAVDSVAAIDVLEGPEELRRAPSTDGELLLWLGKDLAGTAGVPWRPSAPVTTPDELYGALGAAGVLSADLGRPEFQKVYRRFARNAQALYRYRPTGFDGPVLFVRAESGAAPEVVEGWRQLCQGRFRQVTVAGDHYTIVQKPNVDAVAKALSDVQENR